LRVKISTGHELVLFLFRLLLFLFLRVQLGLLSLFLVAFVFFSTTAHDISPFVLQILRKNGTILFREKYLPASRITGKQSQSVSPGFSAGLCIEGLGHPGCRGREIGNDFTIQTTF